MGEVLAYIVVAALVGLLLLAIVSLLRSFLLAIRESRGVAPPPRIARAARPAPVRATGTVTVVAAAAMLWAAAHLVLAVVWAATGRWAPRTVSTGVVAAYACIAAALVGAGGGLLLARRAVGRRTVAWGEFLLGVASVLAVAIALMLPDYEQAPEVLRKSANVLAACFAGHLVIDVLIGTAAQHAGKPRRAMDDRQGVDAGKTR
jgi:hypothetical protein